MKKMLILPILLLLSFGSAQAATTSVTVPGTFVVPAGGIVDLTPSQIDTVGAGASDFEYFWKVNVASAISTISAAITLNSTQFTNAVLALLAADKTTVLTSGAALPGTEVGLSYPMLSGTDYFVRFSGDLDNAQESVVISVSNVPVPAAAWLFGTALLGLFGFKRSARKSGVVAA